MSRQACLFILAATLALPGYGATIRADAYDLRFDLQTGVDPDAYSYPPVSAGLGYFIADNVEIGGLLGIRSADWDSFWITGNVWELGLFGEIHFDVDLNFHPLAGIRLSMLDGEKDSDTAYQLFLYGGGKLFLSENVALAIQAGVAVSDEEIYDVDTHLRPNGTTTQKGDSIGLLLDLGIRYFF